MKWKAHFEIKFGSLAAAVLVVQLTDSGREKVASGGAAGWRRGSKPYSYSSISGATYSIGAGGIQPTSVSGGGAYRAGYSGGTTSFTPSRVVSDDGPNL